MNLRHRSNQTAALLAVAALVTSLTGCVANDCGGKPCSGGIVAASYVGIAFTETPIVIDGKLDEPAWRDAQFVEVKHSFNDPTVTSDPPPMVARYAWDHNYLYIGYEVNDAHVVAHSDGRTKGPKKNQRTCALAWGPDKQLDVVEFFVSMNDPMVMWEVQHNAANHLNDVLDIAPPKGSPINSTTMSMGGVIMAEEQYIRDSGKFTVKWAASLKPKADGKPSTINDPSDTDTGYIGEIRLPWSGIGIPKSYAIEGGGWDLTDQMIVLFAVILQGDHAPDHWTYWHSSPTRANTGMFATTFEHFPRYILTKDTPPAQN